MEQVKYLLILQMMTFSPTGEMLQSSTLKEPQVSLAQCEKKLELRIEEWKKAYDTSSHVGIIGKCVEA